MGKKSRACVIGANPRKVRDFADLLNGGGEFRCDVLLPQTGPVETLAGKPFDLACLFPWEDFDRTGAWITALRPRARSLLLLDDLSVSRLVLLSALETGADGILVWPASLREVRQAIRIIARGGTPLPPELTSLLLDRLRNGRHVNPDWHRLTPSEAKLMTLVAEGLPNKLIADRLGITMGTVQNHLNHVYAKLGAHSRTEALARLFGTKKATDGAVTTSATRQHGR